MHSAEEDAGHEQATEVLSNEPVDLNRHARSLADLAFLEAAGPPVIRLSAALMAYQWAQREAKPWVVNPQVTVYPSLNHLRAFMDANGIERAPVSAESDVPCCYAWPDQNSNRGHVCVDPGRVYHRQTPDHQNLCGSSDPLVDYGHSVTCVDCLRAMASTRVLPSAVTEDGAQ